MTTVPEMLSDSIKKAFELAQKDNPKSAIPLLKDHKIQNTEIMLQAFL